MSTRSFPAASSSVATPRMTLGKNWSSENTRVGDSGTMSAIESVRCVTRLRAAAWGT